MIGISEKGININDKRVDVLPSVMAVVFDKANMTLIQLQQTTDYGLDISLPAHGFKVTYSNSSAVIYVSIIII